MFQPPRLAEFLLRAGGYRAMRRIMQASGRPGSIPADALDRYVEAWRQPGALTAMINWYRAAVRRSVRMGLAAYRQAAQVRVSMPTLILWGEKDVALSRELAPLSAEWCDDVSLVRFPEASHWLQHDEGDRVASRLLAFMV
jgi:pimeloyl-ACP methyl ester carboxylesterase